MKAVVESEKDLRQYSGPDGTGWVCDRCEGQIKTAGDGWLQWIIVAGEPGEHKMRDLSLVHHLPASPRKENQAHGCQFDERMEYRKDGGIVGDLGLDNYCGPDGLMQLLSMVAEYGSSTTEILQMIQRIHIPGYERARLHARRAISEGVFEPNLPSGFYWQADIRAVLDWVNQEKEQ
jgi:hypothetical protein